ncbi:MAG: glycine cleavage system protein GcvH [Oscillatoria princeps RMCB-10]|jgi:glycine cleavage system H protein|nr:glycine cleavage system protein GcvH [Oscillatoria princeps RMCB-10]
MSPHYPDDLKYLDSHEYVRLDGEIAAIGITAYAVTQLGDIVYVELPDIGAALTKGESFGSVESVKAVETLTSPVTGTVVERNEPLNDEPELLAEDPYGEAWLIKVRVDSPDELEDAMSADQYRLLVEGS